MTFAAFEGMAIVGGLGIYFAFGAYFDWAYYRRRRSEANVWKIQPRRFTDARRRRAEVMTSVVNLAGASIVTGLLAYRIATDNPTRVYFGNAPHSFAFGVASTAGYFLTSDFGLYWAHRLMHHPLFYRAVHQWHHRTLAPTAFTASAMHPVEFALYQSVVLAPLFLFPIPAWGVVLTLLYHNVVALFDHSGIDFDGWFPWQPPPRFHDDHHAHFHVNYGQTLGIWDLLFDTWRREGRAYGEQVFGGRGLPNPGAGAASGPARVRYARRAGAAAS